MERPPSSDPTTHPCDHLRTSPPDGPTTCLSPPTLWADCTVDRPLQKPLSKTTVSRTEPTRRPSEIEKTTLKLTPKCSPETLQSPNNPRPQCPPDTPQPPAKTRSHCPPDTRQSPINSRPQAPDTSQPPSDSRPECRPETLQPPNKTKPQCRPDTSQCIIKPRPQCPPDTPQPPNNPRPQCCPDTLKPPHNTRPQCSPITQQSPNNPRPQCPPETSQPPNNPRPQCPPDTRQPPNKTKPQCRPDTSQRPIKPRFQCPPDTPQPPNSPRTQCCPYTSLPPFKPRPQWHRDTPQPVLEAVSSDSVRRPSYLNIVMQSDSVMCVVGVAPPSSPPCVQKPDPSTGSTAVNKARGGLTYDANRTCGSELEPKRDEAGRQLHPGIGVSQGDRPHTPTEEDDAELVIPLDEDGSDDDQNRKKKKRLLGKRRREQKVEEPLTCDLDPDLERALEDGAKQHNLTAVNVRNILHEVITNEHVVAMMKAAITETEGQPLFEPKMTRSKLKEVVEKGVVIPNWNLSPIKKSSKQQFVNIPLEEEDSSGEEYQPEEEDEDETAEESVLESDVESMASSPRGHKRMRVHHLSELQEEDSVDGQQGSPGRHINAESVPMGPPPPPRTRHIQDHTFMEKLHAVEEELDSHPVAMDSLQSLDASLIAFRTRSKKTLKNVPIGQLEAELRAPDITPDMYEGNTADDDDWKDWLCGLMRDDMGNDDEADDDDDPEYNILEDWDEPDTEDLRNDRAVRITKKEVNELMEELFETFQDEMGISHHEDMGADDEDSNMEPLPDFNTPQAIRLEEPLLTDQHRTVRAQLEYLRLRKSLLTKTEDEKFPARESQTHAFRSAPKLPPVMSLDAAQRKRLQQQMQQHIQLLTQLHLLSFRNPKLRAEADTAHMYLAELSTFAESSALTHSPVNPNFQSMFQTCNLKEALELIPMVKSQVPEDMEPPKPCKRNANDAPNLPKHIAWTLATRSVFMYPELLPVCAMKPRGPQDKVFFTKAEDNLLALGLKHFEGIEYSKQLISKYLVTAKTAQQLTVRMKNLTMKKAPDNIIKLYKKTKMLPALSRCCEDVLPQDARPPVESEKHRLPFWIKASLSSIEAEIKSADSRYPLILPPGVSLTLKPLPKHLHRKFWRQRRTTLKPLLIRPNPVPKQVTKPPVPPPVQPAVSIQGIVNMQPLGAAPLGRKVRSATCVSAFSHTVFAATETQVLLPHAASQSSRKSLICALPKRKTEALGGRRTPTLQSAPVVFSVPHGVLKLVSLGTACGVLQPLSTGSAAPVTAVLLNPTPVPLIQMAAPPPCTQTTSRPSGQKSEDDEWECVSITIKVEGEAEETALQGTGPSSDATEHMTSKEEPEVITQSPPSVPLHSLAASPISKTEDAEVEEVNQTQNTEAAGDSPKYTPPSTDGDVEISSPAGVQRDSSSPMDGQDLGNDKDAPEEEEDEDFDDLTQDEDEMSSEESVLSVPELQETMEKLTWLASERRLSQEGDSEDNSQEENTEPEEEEEEEGVDGSSQKPEEMTDEAGDEKLLSNHHRAPSPAPVETNMAPTERRRGVSKAQSSHRARGKRGRTRASKDASKLLLLYDEKILTKDPLREQKDMAFAQSYLNRVREALHSTPGTYQQFLNLIYEFETKGDGKTAVHLYERLRLLLHDWPQLLKDFAAFLLPEQALECGLFEEQQAFDKSRRFLRQLEICFLENPAQHQKIIKLLQSCAECPLQEMGKLKTQMWQLLKGHMHLQEEFSLFFDQLRPPTSRMDDFEVMNWTEDKEYTFDGFEEVTIPDVEEEEEQNKLSAPPRSKRRKDASHGPDKDADWPDGGKDCPCSCHDVVQQRMKRCKRRLCAPCTSKGCNSRSQRSSDAGVSTIKDAGDSRLPLPKSTSSEERPSAGAWGTQESSVSGQRSRSGADPGKGRHQVKVASSRGGRRPHAVKSVVVEKVQRCPSPSETEAPATSSPPCSPPTTSSALCLNPTPEDPSILQFAAQEQTLTVCAKNIKVSSSGEKVVVWTREADRVILTMCKERGAQDDTFSAISAQLDNKSPSEVSQRFRELINLFQTGSVTSSEDEEEGTDLVSEEED